MKLDFNFTVIIELDEKTLIELHGERWFEGARASAAEFALDLKQFLDSHPFVEGCKLRMDQS